MAQALLSSKEAAELSLNAVLERCSAAADLYGPHPGALLVHHAQRDFVLDHRGIKFAK